MAQARCALEFFFVMNMQTAGELHIAISTNEIRLKHDTSPGAVTLVSGIVEAVTSGHRG